MPYCQIAAIHFFSFDIGSDCPWAVCSRRDAHRSISVDLFREMLWRWMPEPSSGTARSSRAFRCDHLSVNSPDIRSVVLWSSGAWTGWMKCVRGLTWTLRRVLSVSRVIRKKLMQQSDRNRLLAPKRSTKEKAGLESAHQPSKTHMCKVVRGDLQPASSCDKRGRRKSKHLPNKLR